MSRQRDLSDQELRDLLAGASISRAVGWQTLGVELHKIETLVAEIQRHRQNAETICANAEEVGGYIDRFADVKDGPDGQPQRNEEMSLMELVREIQSLATRGSKYGARKTVLDGITFDSAAESRRYAQLQLLERGGKIDGLQRQVRFALHAMSGTKIGEYVADFEYYDRAKQIVVTEDYKGAPPTELFKWKARHFEAEYGRPVTIVGRTKRRGKA